MKSNLAQEISEAQGKLVSFPKREEFMSQAKKEDGHTKMPNYLVDDNYVAQMTGNALKCYTVINRFTEGFHRQNWAIDSTFLMEKTGIKKPHTVYGAVKQLEDMGLLSVQRQDGQTSKFTITNPCRKTALPINGTTADNGHRGSAYKRQGGSAENGHTKKETNKKENIKEKKERGISAEKLEEELFSEYLAEHTDPISLKLLSRKQVTLPADLRVQAKKINPELCDDLITAEIKGFAQWSLTRNPVTPQTWMNYWIRRIQNLKVAHSPKLKPQVNPKQPQSKKFTGLSDSQCNVFASKICADVNFASQYAEIGETQKQFVSRITEKLKDPAQVLEWADYLRAVGFEGNLGEQA